MVEGDILVSAPFSGEERALKLTQMHPENEKNKEHKDYSLKNNFFFLSFLFFFFFGSQSCVFAQMDVFECWSLENRDQSE